MTAITMQNTGRLASTFSESLLVHFRRVEDLRSQALDFPSLDLAPRQLCDLELLLNRAFYPLEGYLCQADYNSVLETMRLTDGTLWPMPVCLDVDERLAQRLEPGKPLAIRDSEGFMLAVLNVREVWKADKERESRAVFGTDDPLLHPGVRQFYDDVKSWYVGGAIEGLHLPHHWDFPDLRLTPSETHRIFSRRGWRNVLGFLTDRFPHCIHREMILRASREAGASILLMPVVGQPRLTDQDHYTLVRCYMEFLKHLPRNMTEMTLLPLCSRLAGPREALWEAILQRNFGCTHVAVGDKQSDPFSGSDAATFYPIGAAQRLIQAHEQEIGIKTISKRRMVFVEDKAQYLLEEEISEGMACKHISSQELRRRLEFGLDIPEWYSLPGVVEELRRSYPPRHKQGFTILITGLSGSGKSTLARVLYAKFMELRDRPVTLLDGDIVRKNLSSELNFSREHRNLNVTRIGFVASEITKNRGIAICAPIAPYEESRRVCRELIRPYGGYIEIHMATPIDICEQRDRKGIYAKARAGIMKGVTGVDDPYEVPLQPELAIDTTELTPTEAAQNVIIYLEEQGFLK